MGWLDEALDGCLSDNEALSLLAAGGLWTFISLPIIVPLIPIALSQDPAACLLVPVLLLPGFLFGLVCGYKAIEEGDVTGEGLDLDGLLSFSYDGYGVGLIDPHGDLFEHVLLRVAQMAHRQPQIAERVVVINPCDPHWAIGFNPLQAMAGMPTERLAWFLTDVVLKIWKVDSSAAPRMVWLLVNAFLALSELGLTLVDLPRFLRDQAWRESLVPRLANPQSRGYFLFDFPKTPGAINQWVQPVINKIGAFVFDPDVRAIVGQRRSTISFREILDRQLVLLVNLPKGVMGEENSHLLAAFLVAQFQKAALSRADVRQREPFYLYLDEFQNYTTDNIQDILSESRKYALSLVMAHQYLDQLGGELRKAVLNTAGTIVSLRVGYHDALEMAKEIIGRRVACQCGTKMVGKTNNWNNSYYRCPRAAGALAVRNCSTPYFRVDQVDAAVWGWIKNLLLNPDTLRESLKEQQAEQEEANKPLHDRLAVIDDLLADNRRQLEKLLDLYLAGDFDKEMLTERKARLETTITALEKEQADLVTTLEAQTLTDDQIVTIEDLAKEVAGGLEEAETSFKAKRHIIDLLDVRVTLAIEEGQKVAYVRCLVDEAGLSIAPINTRIRT